MKLIIGLGNPGKKYEKTRHNVGFMVVDKLAQDKGESLDKTKFKSLYEEMRIEGEKVILIKPLTYMNKSGESLALWKEYYKVEDSDILVIYDDMDLDSGKMKVKPRGSPGGHRGMASIINLLGTREIPRLKIGIGKPLKNGEEPSSYVLQKFTAGEVEEINRVIEDAARAAEEFCCRPLNEIMTKYNKTA